MSIKINYSFCNIEYQPITLHVICNSFKSLCRSLKSRHALKVIEKFIRFAYRKRYNGQNMTYEASTFLYAIAVAVFALGGMCGGFVGGWVANKLGR